jgi:putative transposase
MTDARHDDRMMPLIEALEHDEAVVEPTIQRIWGEIPAYRVVTHEQLVDSVHRNLVLACRALVARQVPPAEEIWQAEKATVERLRAGVPIEDIMAGFRVSISSIQDRLVVLADEHGVDGADVVAMTTVLWKLSDAFSARAAAAYRQQGLAVAVADQRRRDEWLLGLLAGTLAPARVEQGHVAYRLRRDAAYRAFCTGLSDHESLERAQRALARQQGDDGGMMMVPTEGQLVGIVAGMPTPVAGHLVAVGPPEALERLAESYAIAQDVLTAARLHFTEGVHTLDGLGWRVAVPMVANVSELLRDRYLDPLRGEGAFGDQVVESLRGYLSHDRSIPQAAAALHVHVNTLRYRLARFEELTGRSLQATDTLVELAWVLYPELTVS